jgi:hypothetical protein
MSQSECYVNRRPGARKRHGIAPAPERIKQTTWKEFLKRHWDQIIATDFFTVEVGGEFIKSRGDRCLVKAATVLPPPI